MVRFEWDSTKASTNLKKHGVSFQDAVPAVLDPFRVEKADSRFDPELRVRVIGYGASGILFVVVVEHDAATRVISARRASAREKEEYRSDRR